MYPPAHCSPVQPGETLQSSILIGWPGQYLPPGPGGGHSHLRPHCSVPGPHVVLQLSQRSHSHQWPSGTKNGRMSHHQHCTCHYFTYYMEEDCKVLFVFDFHDYIQSHFLLCVVLDCHHCKLNPNCNQDIQSCRRWFCARKLSCFLRTMATPSVFCSLSLFQGHML